MLCTEVEIISSDDNESDDNGEDYAYVPKDEMDQASDGDSPVKKSNKGKTGRRRSSAGQSGSMSAQADQFNRGKKIKVEQSSTEVSAGQIATFENHVSQIGECHKELMQAMERQRKELELTRISQDAAMTRKLRAQAYSDARKYDKMSHDDATKASYERYPLQEGEHGYKPPGEWLIM